MNIYQAIMKAADQIQREPTMFRYFSQKLPDVDCGTPGCALGWIAVCAGPDACRLHLGERSNPLSRIATDLLGVGEMTFYQRMYEFDDIRGPKNKSRDWTDSNRRCAAALRLYAEKYHGHEKPVERNFAREVMANLPPLAEGAIESPEYVGG